MVPFLTPSPTLLTNMLGFLFICSHIFLYGCFVEFCWQQKVHEELVGKVCGMALWDYSQFPSCLRLQHRYNRCRWLVKQKCSKQKCVAKGNSVRLCILYIMAVAAVGGPFYVSIIYCLTVAGKYPFLSLHKHRCKCTCSLWTVINGQPQWLQTVLLQFSP